jgi:mono/diheme cytochrome c family protein
MRRMSWVAVAMFVLVSLITGMAFAAGDAVKGKATFEQYCRACHGSGGHGDGPMAASLNPKPKDFSDKAYNGSLKEDHLLKIIKEGGQAVGKAPIMPKFGGTLQDNQIQDVVAFIRSLAKGK